MNSRSLKILLAALVAILVVVCCGFYKIKCDKNAKRFYKQGMGFYRDRNYSDAFYNFKQIKSFSNLYALSLLKQFQCANYLQDKKTAYKKLNELSKINTDSNIRPYVLYNEAVLAQDLQLASNNHLYRKYKYIYENFKESDYAVASAYKMAKLTDKKDKNSVKNKYIEYLNYAPTGKFAQDSLNEIEKTDVFLTKEDSKIIANAYYLNNKFKEALRHYNNTVFADNWYDISKCYRGLGDINSEKETILKGLDAKVKDVNEKDISLAIDRLIYITRADKVQTLQNLYVKYPRSYIFPTVIYKLAESSNSLRAVKLYEYLMDNYPDSIWASNSLWEVFWYNYNLQRYKLCESLAKLHMLNYFDKDDAPRIMYWYGRVLLKEKRTQNAKDIFYKVIDDYPLSYYAFLSARQLKKSKAKKMILKKQIVSYDIDNIKKYIFNDKLLLKLVEYKDFETLDELKISDEYIKSYILNKKQIYPRSITTAKNRFINNKDDNEEADLENKKEKISYSDMELKLIYPVKYEELINENAKLYKISPYLFLSLMREESHFDKNAKSSAGALGLVQLMPATAEFIEKKKVSKEDLLNEEKNVQIGAKYFNYLIQNFNGNEFLAILSYNAGPGNIKKWMENPLIKSSEIDVFVENVPYLETKNYIKKILSSYWVYINIYSPKNRGI